MAATSAGTPRAGKPPKIYYGTGYVAKELGVDHTTIGVWRKRYADTTHPFPDADVALQGADGLQHFGWSEAGLNRIRRWHKAKAGVRGRPGPRPAAARTQPD